MYKFSQYCLVSNSPRSELILFNTLNGRLVKFGSSQDTLKKMLVLKSFDIDANNTLHSFLKDNLFIVPDDYDEFSRAQKYCKMILRNNNVLSLIIMPTMACNFRCSYCYENHKTTVLTEKVKENIVSYIANHINRFDSIEIQWFGGEPLLEIDNMIALSKEIKNTCEQNGKLFRSSITTNGYLLDTHIIEALFNDCNTRTFMITLDGNRESHNCQRPHIYASDSYDSVLRGLLNLKKTNYDFQIIVRTNVTKKMMQFNMECFFNEMYDLFGTDDRFSFMIRKVFGLPEDDTPSIDDMKNLYQIMYRIGLKLTADYQLSYGGNGICYAAKPNHYCIGPDGSVYKCTVQFDNEKNHIGSISNLNFDQSKKIDFWEKSTERLLEGKKICMKCEYFPICAGISCPANISFDLKNNTCSIYNNFKITNEQIVIHSNDINLCIDWDRKDR
jgi:uncharacterized protein